jgi:hypothetical protein
MKAHVYLMCYQGEALVASHLSPEAFGTYMAVGTQKHTAGNLVFFEVDSAAAAAALELGDLDALCPPHRDGSPRRSKYLAIYRVLERLPRSAFLGLHLVTRDGRMLRLEAAPYTDADDGPRVNLYTELSPVTPRVVSELKPAEFAAFITRPDNPLHVPRILFADSLIEREADGSLAGYLPYPNPAHLVDCVLDLEQRRGKKATKTVERNPRLIAFYRTIGRGFFLGDAEGVLFYPFPAREALEEEHFLWWRSASLD